MPPGSLSRSGCEIVELSGSPCFPRWQRNTSAPVIAASATYNEPYNLVTTSSTITREFVALELVSHGRAGWNVVTAPSETKNFGRDA